MSPYPTLTQQQEQQHSKKKCQGEQRTIYPIHFYGRRTLSLSMGTKGVFKHFGRWAFRGDPVSLLLLYRLLNIAPRSTIISSTPYLLMPFNLPLPSSPPSLPTIFSTLIPIIHPHCLVSPLSFPPLPLPPSLSPSHCILILPANVWFGEGLVQMWD